MIKTPNLDLPIYDKPSTDTFKVADWNKANENIDYVFGEFKNNPNVNAIDIKAREDIINNHRSVTEQMDSNMKHCNVLSKYDGIKTDTQIFKEIIKEAYDKTITTSGWRSPLVIKIPSGIYDIDDTIINNLMGLDAGRFIFEGSGWQNTIINFKPTTSKYLLDNYRLFGFATFRGITFSGNTNSKFMRGVGGGGGNAQAFSFFDCRFENFEEIINATGDTMMSEVSFYNCKISGGSANSILFNLANPQAVNWRFYGTDIESFSGILFNYLAGSTINFYQGSIIPVGDGKIINIPNEANVNLFGDGNAPLLNADGVRFEMRGNTKLINVVNYACYVTAHFKACGMGGDNIDTDKFICSFTSAGKIVFDNCYNFNNYKFTHIIHEGSYLNPMYIEFRCSCPTNILTNSTVNKVGNIKGNPIYNFINCGINSITRVGDYIASEDKKFAISKKLVEFGSDKLLTLRNLVVGTKQDISVNMSKIYLCNLNLFFEKPWSGGYGGMVFNIKIYNGDKTTLLGSGTYNTDNAFNIAVPNIYYSFKSNENLVIEFEPVTIWGTIFSCKPHLTLEY